MGDAVDPLVDAGFAEAAAVVGVGAGGDLEPDGGLGRPGGGGCGQRERQCQKAKFGHCPLP